MMAYTQIEDSQYPQANTLSPRRTANQVMYAVYLLALATTISLWFLPFRSGLSVDETGSWWQISEGFSQIWPRGGVALSFPAYTYILWAWTRVTGTSEVALRSLSVLAMMGAAYLLYLAARELFKPDAALFAAITFCIHPIIAYAAVDARPYAFGVLAANAAILVLLRLRKNNSNWAAVLFGLLAASMVYFHYLFATILPAFVICFFLIKNGDRKVMWRQFGIAAAAVLMAFLPLLPGIEDMFRTRAMHVYEQPPGAKEMVQTLLPWVRRPVFVSVAIVLSLFGVIKGREALTGGLAWHGKLQRFLICATLALVPLLIFYGVSVGTSVRLFAPRHRVIVIPGVGLCWGLVISLIPPRVWRLLFCATAVASTSYYYAKMPDSHRHYKSWRETVAVIEKNAPIEGALPMICSNFAESNHVPMPLASPIEDPLFAPLKYYGFNMPFVPLPENLNGETIWVASSYLHEARQNQKSFVAVQEGPPYDTLEWLAKRTADAYDVRDLSVHDGIKVEEFIPKMATNANH